MRPTPRPRPASAPAARRRMPTVLLALAAVAVACGPAVEEGPPPLVVEGGTLIDGTGAEPVTNAAVVIRDGRIASVGKAGEVDTPAGARRIDASGGWIVPGLVDAHVHYSQTGWFDGRPDAADVRDRFPYPEVVAELRANPERYFGAYLCSGVTATFDVGGYPWTRSLEERGAEDPEAPRVEAAGALLSTVDFWLNLPDQRQFVFMDSVSTVREAVRSHAALGSSAVKVWYIVPGSWTSADSARFSRRVHAAGSAADSVGLPLIVHATGLWEAKDAVRAGAEVLVHSVFEEPVDSTFVRMARERDVIYTPTLTVTEGYRNAYLGKTAGEMPYPDRCVDGRTRRLLEAGLPEAERPDWAAGEGELPPNEQLRRGLENLETVAGAGITVAAGTDAGNPGTAHGASIVRELELMARAGMTPMEVLVAATRNGARALGRGEELGTLRPGHRADLVVLSENPLEDVRHVGSVRTVVKAGRVVHEGGDDAGAGPGADDG